MKITVFVNSSSLPADRQHIEHNAAMTIFLEDRNNRVISGYISARLLIVDVKKQAIKDMIKCGVTPRR
jgi:hypothetical protein